MKLALEKLHQALESHQAKLTELQQQQKTGRNVLLGAQKKRIILIEKLIVSCEQRMDEQQGY
jgi:hypothetical protein